MIPPKEEFDKTLEEIAASSEYRILRWKNYLSELMGKLRDNITQWFTEQSTDADWKLPTWFFDSLATVLLVIGVGVIIVTVIFVIVTVIRSRRRETEVKEILGTEITEDTTPQRLKDKAATFKQQGQLRQAIRYDFIALLYLMHQEAILYLDQTKTNQEIYRYLEQDNFCGLDKFQNLIAIFNSTWYGHRPCDSQTYTRWADNLNPLWNEVSKYDEKNK